MTATVFGTESITWSDDCIARAQQLTNGEHFVEHPESARYPHISLALTSDAPVPGWFISATRDAAFMPPPIDDHSIWAWITGPVDWPTLLRERPDDMAVWIDADAHIAQRKWAGIADAYRLIARHDSNASVSAYLYIGPTSPDSVIIQPVELWTSGPIPADLRDEVTGVLEADGCFESLHDLAHQAADTGRAAWRLDD